MESHNQMLKNIYNSMSLVQVMGAGRLQVPAQQCTYIVIHTCAYLDMYVLVCVAHHLLEKPKVLRVSTLVPFYVSAASGFTSQLHK